MPLDILIALAVLLGGPTYRPMAEGQSQASAQAILAEYHKGRSILGGRFILVDTLRADLEAKVTPTGSGRVRYDYVLYHRTNSTGDIDYVAIGPLSQKPVEATAPIHWEMETIQEARGTMLVWRPSELGPAPPGWVDEGNNIYPSAYSVAPGDSLSGFSLTVLGSLDLTTTAPIELKVWQPILSIEEEWVPMCPFRAVGRIVGPGAAGGEAD
ncbi:MAG: hypothetical protein KAY32_18155 [Candidatus Eisenbacteria sp.]|nr:hypothetical protein [Candidatus Eisenbacteria bacterium]